MSHSTRATQFLKAAGVSFTLRSYDYDPSAERIGIAAAEAMGLPPAQVLKTLMAKVDGKPVCVVLASDREVNMKKLAAAVHGKSAEMMKPADAERFTGYVVGGISPFGQKKRVPVVLDDAALAHETVVLNGGQRGLQVELPTAEIVRVLEAIAAPVAG